MQLIGRQLRELRSLGCRPKTQKVCVFSLLKEDNDHQLLKRNMHFPHWVAVDMCLDICGYCRASQVCRPAPGAVRNKTFAIQVLAEDDGGHPEFLWREVEEHTACSCQ